MKMFAHRQETQKKEKGDFMNKIHKRMQALDNEAALKMCLNNHTRVKGAANSACNPFCTWAAIRLASKKLSDITSVAINPRTNSVSQV